jgi:hypothetical protein
MRKWVIETITLLGNLRDADCRYERHFMLQ